MAVVVQVDSSALTKLAKDIDEAKRIMVGRLAERGYQLLRAEVPYQTGNLKQGVASPDVDYPKLEATLTVSARSARSAGGTAEVFDKKGEKKKSVTLRPQPGYNYAEVIARGNRQATLTPTHAKAFMIPVGSAPNDEGYMVLNGQVFVMRRSRKGMKANPFDVRAGKRLQDEAPRIGEAVLREFV